MGELGWFTGQRVELIDGEIMVLSPQGPFHTTSTDRVRRILEHTLGAGVWVRMQFPVDFGSYSEPEPDVSVVPGSLEDYTTAHPTTALLIVEVSDSTLSYDRNRKASLYARAGIADYWIVNLVDGQLEVRRHPVPHSSKRYGFDYDAVTILHRADIVVPLCRPEVRIPVGDLLPSLGSGMEKR
jgi:Uma2 family endonuclease